MTTFLQQVINGLGAGGQYALWAVGYGLVYQILGLMHFAHGDTLIFATFVIFALLTGGVPFPIALVLGMAVGALIAMAIEKFVYRPLVARSQLLLAFVGALGAAYILRNVVTLIWGVQTKVFPYEFLSNSLLHVGGLRIPVLALVNIGCAVAVIVAFEVFLSRSRSGQSVVAVAQDRGAAALMGIKVGKVVALVYGLSAVVGVLGSVLYVAQSRSLDVALGFDITLKAFIAAIIGGIGSIRGALIGGLTLGVVEALIQGYISTLMLNALLFGILIVFLLALPNGFIGRREAVRL
jgi:branched-chain amino acid transport system permease protein